MEFLQWLKGEHEEARQLLQKAIGSEGRARQQAWTMFRNGMAVHHLLEEKYLYPLGEGFAPTRDITEHAIEETQKTDRLLEEIDPSDDSFEERARELRQMIEDHIEEEETELVPQLMNGVPREQQRKLVQKLQQAKKQEMQGAR
jgi:hypothetical protein